MKDAQTQPRRIDALAITVLHLDWQSKSGTPEEAKAKELLDEAIAIWREEGKAKSGELREAAIDEARDLYRAACCLMRNKKDKNCWRNLENAAHRFNAAHQRARNASA